MSHSDTRSSQSLLLPLALLFPVLGGCASISRTIAESAIQRAQAQAIVAQAVQAAEKLTEAGTEEAAPPAQPVVEARETVRSPDPFPMPVPAGGRNGTYADPTYAYQIDATFSPGKLTIKEPNKTSVYTQRPNTQIYDFTNPVNGISYSMAVGDDGRSLHAFKPATPENVTVLNLIREAPQEKPAAAPKPTAGVEKIVIRGEPHYGVRNVPGYRIAGRYLYEGKGEPIVELREDGTGLFQTHGRPAVRVRWWVQAHPNGTVKVNKGPAGQEHILILRYLEPGSAGQEFDMVNLTIDYQRKEIAILNERIKSF